MTATAFTLPGLPPISPPALVVQPALPHLLTVLSVLSSLGFDVTVAETFGDARHVLTGSRPPALLLTDIRLAEYNGLHLVLRGKSTWPTLPALVTSAATDPVLEAESERAGATFVVMPARGEEIRAAILRTVLQDPVPGRPPHPIRPPFERRRADRRVRVGLPPAGERRADDRRRDPVETLRERITVDG